MSNNHILWEGKPQYKPRLAMLEIAGGGAEVGPLTAAVPIVLVLIVVQIVLGIYENDSLSVYGYSALLSYIFIGPEVHKNIRRRKTKYQLYKDSITITNYWYGSSDTQILDLKHVIKLYLVNFKDDIGEIHIFVSDVAPKIVSRNFYSGSKGFNVILYDILDSKETFQKFEDTFTSYQEKTENNTNP